MPAGRHCVLYALHRRSRSETRGVSRGRLGVPRRPGQRLLPDGRWSVLRRRALLPVRSGLRAGDRGVLRAGKRLPNVRRSDLLSWEIASGKQLHRLRRQHVRLLSRGPELPRRPVLSGPEQVCARGGGGVLPQPAELQHRQQGLLPARQDGELLQRRLLQRRPGVFRRYVPLPQQRGVYGRQCLLRQRHLRRPGQHLYVDRWPLLRRRVLPRGTDLRQRSVRHRRRLQDERRLPGELHLQRAELWHRALRQLSAGRMRLRLTALWGRCVHLQPGDR